MENGKWFLKFTIRFVGETSIGEPFKLSTKTKFPLLSNNFKDAEMEAKTIIDAITQAFNTKDKDFLSSYFGSIDDEDGVTVLDFFICFEKLIDVPELSIIGSP